MTDFIRKRDEWIRQVLKCPKLNGTQTRVLTMFAMCADNKSGEAYISNAKLGKEIGSTGQTVSRAMSAGVDAGFIYEVSRGGTSTGTRLTSTRRCVFPTAGQTTVNPDVGIEQSTADTGINTARPMSDPTRTHVRSDIDPRQDLHGPMSNLTRTHVESDYPTKPLTKPITNQVTKPDNSLDTSSLGNAREDDVAPGDFDGIRSSWEEGSLQTSTPSTEGCFTEKEIDENWDLVNSSVSGEPLEEVATLPAGDRDRTSSDEPFPVHADTGSLDVSIREPVIPEKESTEEEEPTGWRARIANSKARNPRSASI